jgi:hypothetical protein
MLPCALDFGYATKVVSSPALGRKTHVPSLGYGEGFYGEIGAGFDALSGFAIYLATAGGPARAILACLSGGSRRFYEKKIVRECDPQTG